MCDPVKEIEIFEFDAEKIEKVCERFDIAGFIVKPCDVIGEMLDMYLDSYLKDNESILKGSETRKEKVLMNKQKDYYKELDNALKYYEERRSYISLTIDQITNKIDWCWKFRKITEEQMEELANRVVMVLER